MDMKLSSMYRYNPNNVVGITCSTIPMAMNVDGKINTLGFAIDIYRKQDSLHLGRIIVDIEKLFSNIIEKENK